MTDKNHEMELHKEEIISENGERTHDRACFIPRTDVFETDQGIQFLVDMPGVEPGSVDITLEKNVLTIQGFTKEVSIEGYSLIYGEYPEGDYMRKFTINNEIDVDRIEAMMDHGVLTLELPKKTPSRTKISVKALS